MAVGTTSRGRVARSAPSYIDRTPFFGMTELMRAISAEVAHVESAETW